jgi:Flp pilus assembly protein TadD
VARHRNNKQKVAVSRKQTAVRDSSVLPDVLIALALVAANVVIYWQLRTHEFITLDDDLYVVNNDVLHGGLSTRMLAWAFTSFRAANWHPLTWISHALDFQLFGLSAGGHHITNLVLHCVNSLLAFLVFKRLTRAMWCSALLAALFAVHPLHVESVAWVAERKDVLSTLFWLLTMWAYARYVDDIGDGKRMLVVAVTLALGLMAKPMLVTLPFALLLLDYWPLRRLEWEPGKPLSQLKDALVPLVKEKLPLFGLVLLAIVITFIAQKRGGAVQTFERLSFGDRLGNALVAYLSYLLEVFWPLNLGVYYPLPINGRPLWQIGVALLVLAAISWLAIRSARSRPYMLFGWLWFLGTLVPVIGIIQVGAQSMADRYTYIPYFGLFVIIVWGIAERFVDLELPRTIRAVVAGAVLLSLGFLSWKQVGYWQNSNELFEHTLSVTENNVVMDTKLGVLLGRQGEHAEAQAHFEKALKVAPNFYNALFNMGATLAARGRFQESIEYYDKALKVRPGSTEVLVRKAGAFAEQGQFTEALPPLDEALRVDPNDADAHTNMGLVLLRLGRWDEALTHLKHVISLRPNSAEAVNNLGLAYLAQGNNAGARDAFARALQINPSFSPAQTNLKRAQSGATSQ